jgi:hypothetical protein
VERLPAVLWRGAQHPGTHLSRLKHVHLHEAFRIAQTLT